MVMGLTCNQRYAHAHTAIDNRIANGMSSKLAFAFAFPAVTEIDLNDLVSNRIVKQKEYNSLFS